MSDTDSNYINLPSFGIQCDWDQALRKQGGSCWISAKCLGEETSFHGDLKSISSSQTSITISGNPPFSAIPEKTGARFVTVKEEHSEYECSFLAPGSEFGHIHKAGVISLDVSEGGLGVSVCKNNELKIWETDTGNVRRVLQGHIIDAYTCRFFPSGIVVLSGGADCCLKIWSAETGDCPVVLKGHTASIQDTCVVERGRNIISVSKDGTAKLFDCGTSKCLATLISCNAAINSCCLMSPTNFDLGPPSSNINEREILTVGKLLIIGREDCKVNGISVSGRHILFTCSLPSAVNRVIQVGPNSFAVGCQGGEIAIFDLKNVSQPQFIVSSTTSPILDLMVHPRFQPLKSALGETINCFWASKSDGTCVLINPSKPSQSSKKLVLLTGPDCDPVYQIKNDLDAIYTACRDGLIRKYSLNLIDKLLR